MKNRVGREMPVEYDTNPRHIGTFQKTSFIDEIGINQRPPVCIYSQCFCWFLETTKNSDNDMFECWV